MHLLSPKAIHGGEEKAERCEAFEKLKRTLSEEGLERISEEYKRFRKEFSFR